MNWCDEITLTCVIVLHYFILRLFVLIKGILKHSSGNGIISICDLKVSKTNSDSCFFLHRLHSNIFCKIISCAFVIVVRARPAPAPSQTPTADSIRDSMFVQMTQMFAHSNVCQNCEQFNLISLNPAKRTPMQHKRTRLRRVQQRRKMTIARNRDRKDSV
jgi:hypothetical protein